MANLPVPGGWMAPGFWGRRPDTHINALQVPQKVLALNYHKVKAMGLPFRVWKRLVSASEPRSIQCSCFSDTAQQSDSPCLSCYGERYQPGYLKFGYRTTFYSSTHGDLVTTNIAINQIITPYRMQLTAAALSGIIVTPTYPIQDINIGTWEAKLDGSVRDPTNVLLGEFSLDNGTTWFPLSTIGGVGKNPTLSQTIKFRITLSRSSTSIKSPVFEILRARFPYIPPLRNSDMNPGEILLLKTWDVERYVRDKLGNNTENQGQHYWTLPLSFFDHTIDRETSAAVLGKDHFVEDARGPEAGKRYIATKHSFSRTFKIFTQQSFDLRRIAGDPGQLNGEAMNRVW